MRTFECVCDNVLFFENSLCTQCEREVGWCPHCDGMSPIEPAGTAWRCVRCETALLKCHNYIVEHVCNRMLLAEGADPAVQPLCDCCRHNTLIPDLSVPGHRERWARLEEAKRRLMYQLDALGLPRGDDQDPPLRFQFLTDAIPQGPGQWRSAGDEQVMTGHADGVITINVREADDAERARVRLQMGEDYRPLLGHFRHEVGHYYWDVLVDPDPALRERFVQLFGDPLDPPYGEALKRHYDQGPPADWAERYTTTYATMHPWEDWAETWAAYLELASTLDTAVELGLGRGSVSPYAEAIPLDALLPRYRALGIDLNEMNRAMGLNDILTRNFPDPVVAKLHFVHEVIHASTP